jgi:hypothetical protein
MVKGKIIRGKKKIVKSSEPFISKRTLIIIGVVLVIGGIIGVVLYFTVFKNSGSSSGGNTPTGPPGSNPTGQPGPNPTGQPGPPGPPVKPSGKVIGAWSSLIGCGSDYFNIISLSGAYPQDYDPTSYTKFFALVIGDFNANLSSGNSKYIISIGGSNATSAGWILMFNGLSDPTNNYINLQNFISACKCRGIVGIDLDLEQEPTNIDTNNYSNNYYTTNNTTTKIHKALDSKMYVNSSGTVIDAINTIMNQIKIIDPNFIIMLTILLGSPASFAGLLNNPNYDYLTLMLYNGGMYQAGLTGAGCNWDQWAELILSKGTAGCPTPLNENPPSAVTYPTDANLSAVVPSKVLLGLIIDTIPTHSNDIALNASIVSRANQLIDQYGGGGQMIWVIPGFQQNCVSALNALGYNFDASKCAASNTCIKSPTPCNSTGNCIATSCGANLEGVTDAQCEPCASGQTWWPCDSNPGSIGFCQLQGAPTPTCL